jgi:PAS domain-containing protein
MDPEIGYALIGAIATTPEKGHARNRSGAFRGTGESCPELRRSLPTEKQAEEVRQSEQRWRSLTEALPQLVWSATPDSDCDYLSTQWSQHTGVGSGRSATGD